MISTGISAYLKNIHEIISSNTITTNYIVVKMVAVQSRLRNGKSSSVSYMNMAKGNRILIVAKIVSMITYQNVTISNSMPTPL